MWARVLPRSLRGQFARVAISEVDPICALQACMMGFDVVTLEDVVGKYDIFVTATGNKDIITAEHMMQMRHNAIVCNIGHFDNEIDMAGLEKMAEEGLVQKIKIKEGTHEWKFTNTTHGPNGGGHSVIILAEGRLVNSGLCNRSSFFGDVCVIHQPDHRSNRASSVC